MKPLPRRISLVPFRLAVDLAEALPALAERTRRELRLPVDVRMEQLDVDAAHDPTRGQFNSRVLLEQLSALAAPGEVLAGVTALDLFIPVLTYVFGEAILDGNAALVSACRLDPTRYGLPPSLDTVAERLLKELVHELGHTLGLVHCVSPTCVMASSTYAEQIDLKSVHLCGVCRREGLERRR